jgi:hypothetical protein
MSEANDVNTQAQPVPPVSAGPSADELRVELERVRKESEGRLRDLQAERAEKQELKARLTTPAPSAVKQDELGEVLQPYIAPVAKAAREAQQELDGIRLEKAQSYLASKTGKSWEELQADTVFQDRLNSVVRKYGLSGNVYDIATKGYELMQLEDLKNKEVERARAANTANVGSLPSGTGVVSAVTSKKYTSDEFDAMSPSDFGRLEKSGNFRRLDDGSFEYIPRS